MFSLFFLWLFSAQAETLQQKQAQFSQLAAKLITHAKVMGYEVTLGEAYRTPEQASFQIPMKWNEAHGIGISNSLHILRLAIDINLFKDGKYLGESSAYKPLGEWWEKQCTLCRWGGRFKRADGNHFSISHGGIQ